MRPRRLVVRAFGPFAGEETVAFSELAADGIFTISGRTGAGKTSLLDAICFALYGEVPGDRLGSGLRSHHAVPTLETSVELEFSVRGDEYLVHRIPDQERAAKRGNKTTKAKHKVVISKRIAGSWMPVASSIGEAKALVESVVGLDVAQFTQVVLIPQGAFAEALRAKADVRRALLSSLFGTSRFAEATDELVSAAARLGEGVRSRRDEMARIDAGATARWDELEIEGVRPADEEALAAVLEDRRTGLEAIAARARLAASDARDACTAAERHNLRAEEIRSARVEEAQLIAASRAIDALRSGIARADAAAPLVGVVDATVASAHAVAHAEAELVAVAEALETARGDIPPEWIATADPEPHAPGDDAAVARYDDLVRRAEAVCTHATAADHAAEEQARAESRAASVATEQHARDRDVVSLRSTVAELEKTRDAAVGAGAQAEALDRDAAAAHENVRACRAAADLEAARTEAVAALAAAHAFVVEVDERHRDLWERRVRSIAGELASALEPGSPCAVCGSTEHPAPAVAEDPVTDSMVLEAQTDRERAERSRTVATDRIAELDVARAELSTDGGSVEAAEQRVVAADAAAAGAREAAARLGALDEAIVEAQGQLESATSRSEVLRAEGERETAAAAAAAVAVVAAEAVIAAEIGPGRNAAAVLGGARAAAEAARRRDGVERAVVAAIARREECAGIEAAALRQAGFDSPESLRAAVLDSGTRSEHLARIEDHDQAQVRVAGALAGVDPDTDVTARATDDLEAAVARTGSELEVAVAALAVNAKIARELTTAVARYDALATELGPLAARWERADEIARACRGDNRMKMHLEAFVLAAYLEEIVESASKRIGVMTQGRYALRHSDARARHNAQSGLDLLVFDAYTGTERDVSTLSGGETFQASLALALATAEVVRRHQGGLELECLFIDEGFATLDAEVLELALGELDALRVGGRMVGVISHLREVTDRIPTGIAIEAAAGGGSRIRLAHETGSSLSV